MYDNKFYYPFLDYITYIIIININDIKCIAIGVDTVDSNMIIFVLWYYYGNILFLNVHLPDKQKNTWLTYCCHRLYYALMWCKVFYTSFIMYAATWRIVWWCEQFIYSTRSAVQSYMDATDRKHTCLIHHTHAPLMALWYCRSFEQ